MIDEIPEFRPSAETTILCRDTDDEILKHLLIQADISRQQSYYIMREQLKSFTLITNHTETFTQHEESNRIEFDAMKNSFNPVVEKVLSWSKWLDFIFSRNGLIAGFCGVIIAPILINICTSHYSAKISNVMTTNSVSVITK